MKNMLTKLSHVNQDTQSHLTTFPQKSDLERVKALFIKKNKTNNDKRRTRGVKRRRRRRTKSSTVEKAKNELEEREAGKGKTEVSCPEQRGEE